jgi:predicted Zn-dependent protease
MKRLIMLVALVITACDAPTVPERLFRDVYEFRLNTSPPKVLRWPVGSTVKVFVVTNSSASQSAWLNAGVEQGAEAWNEAALYREVTLVPTTNIAEADAVVMYSLSTTPVDLSGCLPSGPDAVTTFCPSSTEAGRLKVFPMKDGSPSRVKFVVSVRETAATDEVTTRRLVTHELGHVRGIGRHSTAVNDLMYGGAVLIQDKPNLRDRSTLEVLYHSEADITP